MQNIFNKNFFYMFLLFNYFYIDLYSTYLTDENNLNLKSLKQNLRQNISDQTIIDTKNTIQELVQLIRNEPVEKLTDAHYLEHEFLLKLGLNNEALHEFPSHLNEYYGKGLKSWQYPVQFSKFLVSLSKLKVTTYLEIGCRHGGTFIIISEYLKRFNPNVESYAVDPFYSLIMDIYTTDINSNANYIVDYSFSPKFINLSEHHWDIAFIDGDHSWEGVKNDYNLVKKNSDILVFHDIVNDFCYPVRDFWNLLKKIYLNSKIEEFIEQYEEVVDRQKMQYLGIGVIYQNEVH